MGGAAGFLGAFDRPSYAGLPWDTEPNANTPGTSTSTGPLDFLANSPEGARAAYNPTTPPRSHVPGPRKLRIDPELRTEDEYHETRRQEEEARKAADLERARQTIVDELNQETADDETPPYQSDSVSGETLTVPAQALLRDVLRDDFFALYKEQKGALCFTLADSPRSTEKWLVQSGLRSGEETMGEIVEQLNKGPGREVAATVCDRTATGEEALNAPAELHLQAVMLQMPKRVRVYFPLPPFPDDLDFPGALVPQHIDPFAVEHHLNIAVARGRLDLDGVWQREFPSLLTVDDLVTRIRDHYKRYYIDRYPVEDTRSNDGGRYEGAGGALWALPAALATRALQIKLPSLYLERVAADRVPANGEQEPAAQPPANGLTRDRLVREAKLQRLARDRLVRSQEEIDDGKTTGNLFPLVENNLKDTATARQGLWEVCAKLPVPAENDGNECTLRVVAPEAPPAALPVPRLERSVPRLRNQGPAPDAA
eukprot:g9968.t1